MIEPRAFKRTWLAQLNVQEGKMQMKSAKASAIDALASCFVDNLDLQSPNGELQLRSMMGRLKCKRLLAGHYVSTLYLFTKLFYTLNIVVQFMILNACLKSDEYLFFGFQ
ncbi:hypothetical protein TELCIR_19837, partial [Teladorsagia circumcincta]